jgi:hypothetical protein
MHLLCDLHASHRGPDACAVTLALGIQLHLIPASLPDEGQTLDIRTFRVLKARLIRGGEARSGGRHDLGMGEHQSDRH